MVRVPPTSILRSQASLRSITLQRGSRLAVVIALAVLMVFFSLWAYGGIGQAAPAVSPSAPSETRLSQRVQNTWSSSSSAVTGTYGELLTVTLRFTITENTVLTGPVSLQAGFNSITTTAAYSNRLGLRFLGYQGPYTRALGTPDLAVTNFVSDPTRLVGGRPSTYLTWTFGTITNPLGSGVSYVYEIDYQVRLAWDGRRDTDASATILGNPDTKLMWQGGNTTSLPSPPVQLRIDLRQPTLDPPNSIKTFGLPAGFQGSALIFYTVTLRNGNNPTNFTAAYDLAVTDTLDSRLAYNSASPPPSGSSGNVLTWSQSDWTLAPNATWVARITATLPSSFAANDAFTNTVTVGYSTFPGAPPDEGVFTSVISTVPRGGVVVSKQVLPSTNVKIGDGVTYTVRMTVSPNVYMNSPVFTDTLPDGFHWNVGSFDFSGDAILVPGSPFTGTAGVKELLVWRIESLSGSAPRYMTVVYAATLTGLKTDGSVAWTSLGSSNADNSVAATWTDVGGNQLALLSPLPFARVTVVQPNLSGNNLSKTGPTWAGNDQEIEALATYAIQINNTGAITAYEVVLTDILPPGMVFEQYLGVSPSSIQVITRPNPGDSGNLSFVIAELPRNILTTIQFQARVTNQARPGDWLVNQIQVADYTSQPGADNPYDRHYKDIAGALPGTKSSSAFQVRGLTATKTDSPDPVQPGQVLTYSIIYSNTSLVTPASGVYITDTYDANLQYLSATSLPDIGAPVHDANARLLAWGPLGLPINTLDQRITATFQVNTSVSRTVRVLSNTITSDWSSSAPAVSRLVTTTLVQPMPAIVLDDKGISVTAGSLLTYTTIYSNAPASTGATTSTFTVTLNYPVEYLSFKQPLGCSAIKCYFVNATPGAVVLTGTLGVGISSTVSLVMTVTRPLPYALYGFTSTATIVDRVLGTDASASDGENTPVLLPRFEAAKWNSNPSGNPPVGPNELIGYKIAVTNTDLSVTATNVVITEVWDANTHSPSGGAGWDIYDSFAVYTIPTIAPNTSFQVPGIFSLYVTSTLAPDVQQIVNTLRVASRDTTAQETSYSTPVAGINLQKYAEPNPVFPGATLAYTINYQVDSATGAISPQITDTLPANVTYLGCGVDNGGTCGRQGGDVVWTWGTLGANVQGVLTISVQAPTTEWITLTNRYASRSDYTPFRTGSAVRTYVGRPHLSLSKIAATAYQPIAPGDLITYTITYTNAGSYKSTNTQVHDTLPANTTFWSCSGAPCSQASNVVTWSLGDVPVTTTGHLTLVARVNPAAGTTTIVNSTFSIQADRGVVGENTPPSVSTQVRQPQLAVVKTASPIWVSVNGYLTYTVRYTNTGGGILTTLLFTDTLDSQTTFQSASANCANQAGVVTCSNTPLLPGQSGVFNIAVKVNPGVLNNALLINVVSYLFDNQRTSGLPVQAATTPVEVPVSGVGAAADFVGAPLSGAYPLTVTFTNLSSGSGITGYWWDFGDGATSTSGAPTVVHTYSSPGVYTVTLTVITGSGNNTRTRRSYITVTGTVVRGVTLTPATAAQTGLRGKVVTYTLTIRNTGSLSDSFDLTLSGNQWPNVSLSAIQAGPLLPNGTSTVSVYVTVPPTATKGMTGTVTVKATSLASPSTSATSVLTTTADLSYYIYLPIMLRQ